MNGKEQLEALRSDIDKVDNELWPLLQKRMQIVQQVAEVKQQNNLAVLDAKREQEILDKVDAATSPDMRGEVSLLMRTLLALSKSRQRKAHFGNDLELLPAPAAPHAQDVVCAYQGMPGAWSQQALRELYPSAQDLAVERFEDVFQAVRQGQAHYGVVPIENSQTGAIGETYDLLRKYGCYIVGRTTLDIRQCLLAPKGAALSDIRRVYSHPEALSQCRHFLHKHHWEQNACRNTAVAAKRVAEENDPHAAAVASAYAAECYGLTVLEKDIMDTTGNRTSFIVIAAQPEYDQNSQMVSITFSTAHRSGALCEILLPFMAFGINLARIESRPGTAGNYRFFADLEGNLLHEEMTAALRQAAAAGEYFEVLGCYQNL